MNEMQNMLYRYLEGKLDTEEQVWFEKKMAEDSELRKEYELQKEIKEAISEEDVIDLRAKLKKITSEDYYNTKVKRQLWKKRILYAAAVFVIFVSAGSWFYFHQLRSSPEDLFSKYYQPYDNIYSSRSIDQAFSEKKIITKGFHAYGNSEWKDAEAHFDVILKQNPKQASLLFYAGIVKLERNKSKEAIELFNKVIEQKNPMFIEQAYWYTALIYLKNGDTQTARRYLEQIIERGMTNKDKADKILKKL